MEEIKQYCQFCEHRDKKTKKCKISGEFVKKKKSCDMNSFKKK